MLIPLQASEEIAWVTLTLGLLGGLALFLLGIEMMTNALKILAGGGLKKLLERMTTNRFKAALTGAFVTAVINSSSVTTVLVVGFISAGAMSLSQSIGVIMGANIGSTFTAQVIAFKVTTLALPMIAAGYLASVLARQEKIRESGTMLLGLGLLFLGMGVMSDATYPLRTHEPFIALMQRMNNPLLGIGVGMLFTALVQSSAATTGIVIMLATQGFVTLEAGIALAFGANIGTCVTALLAAIGKPREAVQAAVVHVLFNVLGVLIWLPLIGTLADFVIHVSPKSPELEGVARIAAECPRQIANAHTLFNIANTLIFIWFTAPLAAAVQRLVPLREGEDEIPQPKFLERQLLDTPSLALANTRLELTHLGGLVVNVTDRLAPVVTEGGSREISTFDRPIEGIRTIHRAIVVHLGLLSRRDLSYDQSRETEVFITIGNELLNIAEVVPHVILNIARERSRMGIRFGESTVRVIWELAKSVRLELGRVVVAVAHTDGELAKEIIDDKDIIHRQGAAAKAHLVRRLAETEGDRYEAYRLESEIVTALKRIYYHIKRIAKTLAEAELEIEVGEIHPEGNEAESDQGPER
jgi:phosphate:Na+ symporter